jgi:hypothetical protein
MVYQGIFTHDNLKSLLSMTEGSVSRGEDIGFKKKAVNVMVELLQNICNHAHSPKTDSSGKPGILIISTNTKGCYISSGNYILTDWVQAIKNKIELINSLDEGALENLYSETISKEHDQLQKGAGLGFMDIRMKSGHSIESTFVACSNSISFLAINTFIAF